MAEYLIQDTTLTNIAAPIKTLMGLTDNLTTDEMVSNLNDANTAVANALVALTEKEVVVPDGSNVTNLADLIESIEAGGGGDVVYTCGSFTPSEAIELNNSVTDPAYVVEHNLGVVPNLFLMGKFDNGYANALDLFIVRSKILGESPVALHTAERIKEAGSSIRMTITSNCIGWPITENAIPIIPYITNETKYILVPKEYHWIAIGGLAE